MPSFPHSIKKDVPEYNAQQVRKLLLYAKEHESHIYIFLLLGNGYDKSHDFIVRTVLGKPYVNLSAINRVVNRLTENAGLPHCTIHGFRHSVASILDDNGVPIQDISVLLGHESVNTTERIYINRRKTAKETTINALDSAINLNIA